MNLSVLILVSLGLGIVSGAVIHEFFPDWIYLLDHYLLNPAGQIFLRLIQFVVVPIVFSSLIIGLTRIQSASQIGRYLLKLLTSYLLTSITAISLGLAIATFFHPGVGIIGLKNSAIIDAGSSADLLDWLINLIPTNPIEALSKSNLLQVVFSGALISIGIQKSGEKANNFIGLVESIYAISENLLSFILNIAPIGVFGLIASIIANQGILILIKLFTYMAVVVLAIGLMFTLYLIFLSSIQCQPIKFLQKFFPSLTLAFATASSNAALPLALNDAQAFGMSPQTANFAIPLGTALKRDGMAVGQAVNALFIAQLYQIPIDGKLLFTVALSTLLVSFSTAGVPGAGIVMMTTIFSASGLPLEGVALLAGVDRLMDSFHTILNLQSNLANAIILDWWESPKITREVMPNQ